LPFEVRKRSDDLVQQTAEWDPANAPFHEVTVLVMVPSQLWSRLLIYLNRHQ